MSCRNFVAANFLVRVVNFDKLLLGLKHKLGEEEAYASLETTKSSANIIVKSKIWKILSVLKLRFKQETAGMIPFYLLYSYQILSGFYNH